MEQLKIKKLKRRLTTYTAKKKLIDLFIYTEFKFK